MTLQENIPGFRASGLPGFRASGLPASGMDLDSLGWNWVDGV